MKQLSDREKLAGQVIVEGVKLGNFGLLKAKRRGNNEDVTLIIIKGKHPVTGKDLALPLGLLLEAEKAMAEFIPELAPSTDKPKTDEDFLKEMGIANEKWGAN